MVKIPAGTPGNAVEIRFKKEVPGRPVQVEVDVKLCFKETTGTLKLHFTYPILDKYQIKMI